MAPFAGRAHEAQFAWGGAVHRLPAHAPPHALHGTVVDAAWSVLSATDTGVVLEQALDDPWPFEGAVHCELSLHQDGLDAALRLVALEPMPVTLGWHPWFRRQLGRGGMLQVQLDPVQQYERGADGLPTGRLIAPTAGPHDDCFLGVRAAPRLVWPHALELELDSATDHWVLYDEHPDAVCVEPQTGPPDAVHLGRAAVVPAGGVLELTMTMRWWTTAGPGEGTHRDG